MAKNALFGVKNASKLLVKKPFFTVEKTSRNRQQLTVLPIKYSQVPNTRGVLINGERGSSKSFTINKPGV